MGLIDNSKEIFNQLDISGLQKAEIQKEDVKLYSHSHIIVTYPPLDALKEVKPNQIYSLRDKKKPREIALYLHLPFCTGKCLYCAYITMANQPTGFIDKYLDAIEKEANMLLEYPILKDVMINSIYIGGGTPTYLTANQLDRIFKFLNSKFNIKKDAEITIEAGPETLIAKDGKEKLKTLLKNGVNRLSLGFQTFNDTILKIVNRRHTSEEAIKAYKIAKETGFKNINIDLMFGLPDQNMEMWKNDLEHIQKLNPDSVTCYPMYVKKTAPIYPMYQKAGHRFPSGKDILIMRIMANEFFNDLGYTQNPVCWFTKTPKFVYKQQIHKWEEIGEQLALGCSSYSFINNWQYFNYRTVPEYLNAIGTRTLSIWKGTKLSKEDLMRRLIVFGLRTGFNKKSFELRFGVNPKDIFKDTWKKIERFGLIEESDNTIQLSYKGKLLADEVSKEFYSEDVKKALNK